MKTSFSKPPLSYEQQVVLLQSRNLTICNASFAKTKLSHLNYYRLSAYYLPFYDSKEQFIEETQFEDVVRLYYFDKKLRNIIFYAIEKIEVYLRSQVAYVLARDLDAFGYTDHNNFTTRRASHEALMKSIASEVKRSKEVFVKHFFAKHTQEDLPIWMMVEIISFGTLSKLYKALNTEQKREITRGLGLPQKVFDSWFHSLVYVRNICAHHSRMWNKVLSIKPEIPRKIELFKTLNNNKIFFTLTMIEFLLNKIDDDEYLLKDEIIQLLKEHPSVDVTKMGFTQDWQELEVWREYE